tara:strand:- start:65914 stop:66144 length:231 start_codon:yes stop_codon:yes gene_type:complete
MSEEDIIKLIKSTIKENLEVDIYTESANTIGSNVVVELAFKGEEEPFYRNISYLTADYSEEEWMGDVSKDVIIEIC